MYFTSRPWRRMVLEDSHLSADCPHHSLPSLKVDIFSPMSGHCHSFHWMDDMDDLAEWKNGAAIANQAGIFAAWSTVHTKSSRNVERARRRRDRIINGLRLEKSASRPNIDTIVKQAKERIWIMKRMIAVVALTTWEVKYYMSKPNVFHDATPRLWAVTPLLSIVS